jgi:AcrR family transcriptional regulator
VPTPPRTSLEEIVRAGRAILDTDGLDALTMRSVAAIVGVRAPSLYKRVRDRDALVRLIAADVVNDLGAALSGAVTRTDSLADLRAISIAFRAWAHRHPGGFGLLFSPLPDAWRLEPAAGGDALEALFGTVAGLVAPEEVLDASRTVVAWAAGFVGMELAGAFRLGGDVDTAFSYGVERLGEAIASAGAGSSPDAVASQQATFGGHV